MPKKKVQKSISTTIYLHNATEKPVEFDGKVVDPGDAVSIPIELEKEAREKGLE